MSNQPIIHIFSKDGCPYCKRAKAILKEEGLSYVEHDIKKSSAVAAASMYLSGRTTVPQIFFGNQHINGADDLQALQKAGLLKPLLENCSGDITLDPSLEKKWQEGSEDFTLATVLEKVDLTKNLDDQENLVILSAYKRLFGFIPICYSYLGIWPEAFKACALSNVMANMQAAVPTIGPSGFSVVSYTASSTQGCNYCTVHAAARGGKEQTSEIKQFLSYKEGKPEPGNPFGDLDVALAELAEQATLNKVTDEQIAKLSKLAKEASKDPAQVIQGVGLGAETMSLLNVFNDLTNVALEGGMASLAKEDLGLDSGRHATTDSDPNNLDMDLPVPKLTVEAAVGARAEKAKNWRAVAEQHLGYVPSWLEVWPRMVLPLFIGMYTELMSTTEFVDAELKHLMARVSAIAKGHVAAAASAAVSAHHSAKDKARAIERIKGCYAAATGQPSMATSGLFSDTEKAALRFAWLSAQTPIITPAQFVKPMVEHFSHRQIVELIVACGMACSVQRMSAALQVQMSSLEETFCAQNGIETDILKAQYPAATGSN